MARLQAPTSATLLRDQATAHALGCFERLMGNCGDQGKDRAIAEHLHGDRASFRGDELGNEGHDEQTGIGIRDVGDESDSDMRASDARPLGAKQMRLRAEIALNPSHSRLSGPGMRTKSLVMGRAP